ncbi:MAG: hypothetical protein H6667_11995 [Ardenticatenaceae bacterium]|nr:hypothetical protein [Ardenticatenaceae bacterium]
MAEFLGEWRNPLFYVMTIILMILFGWVLWETYQANNFGFLLGLWDWMELLVIPVVLLCCWLFV